VFRDATNLATELYTSRHRSTRDNPGGAVKFAAPTLANSKVYVGTQTKLSVFALLASPTVADTPDPGVGSDKGEGELDRR
jgi:hypothetical protein